MGNVPPRTVWSFLTWVRVNALWFFSPFSHFITSKIKEFLTLPFSSQFLLFLDPLLSSLLASKYLVLWESKCTFNCFDYTCEIIELFQVLTYPYKAQCHAMKELQMLILKHQTIGWCFCKEPLTALESVDGPFTAKIHSLMKSHNNSYWSNSYWTSWTKLRLSWYSVKTSCWAKSPRGVCVHTWGGCV